MFRTERAFPDLADRLLGRSTSPLSPPAAALWAFCLDINNTKRRNPRNPRDTEPFATKRNQHHSMNVNRRSESPQEPRCATVARHRQLRTQKDLLHPPVLDQFLGLGGTGCCSPGISLALQRWLTARSSPASSLSLSLCRFPGRCAVVPLCRFSDACQPIKPGTDNSNHREQPGNLSQPHSSGLPICPGHPVSAAP
jgi:hypothetical protein